MPGRYICPVCERDVDDAIIPFHKNVERQILERIRSRNPRWIEPDGSVPKCVDYYKALIEARLVGEPDDAVRTLWSQESFLAPPLEAWLREYRTRARRLTPGHFAPSEFAKANEVAHLVDQVGDRQQHLRLLICMLYFGTGLRAEELLELGVSAVQDTGERQLAIEPPIPAAFQSQVWLDPESTAVLRQWRNRLPPRQTRLFLDEHGLPLTRSMLYRWVTRIRDAEDEAFEHFFPIYHESDYVILPTSLRLNADTHYTGRGVTIAFIDSGFYPHPDLVKPRNRVKAYVNVPEPELDDFAEPQEASWHGMQTSVSAAGNGFLSHGLYKALAPDADVVLLKVRGRHGFQTRHIIEAFEWILRHQHTYNIRIVNISLSGDRPGSFLRSALDQAAEAAVQAGIVVVAAAGNSGWDQGSEVIRPPASAPSVITVGGLNDNNRLDVNSYEMYWSSYGPTLDGILKPELVAPGIWIAAPLLPGTSIYKEAHWLHKLIRSDNASLAARVREARQDGLDWPEHWEHLDGPSMRRVIDERLKTHKLAPPYYQHVDGTSFAAPIVCSVIAQMLEANPHLTPARIKSILTRTADKLFNVPTTRQGHGLIHPRKAVKEAANDLHRTGYKRPSSPHVKGREVTFYFKAVQARSVHVAGEFNGWSRDGLPMRLVAPHVWMATLTLTEPGSYAYKFVIDGHLWRTDPENNNQEPDGFGGVNCRVNVVL